MGSNGYQTIFTHHERVSYSTGLKTVHRGKKNIKGSDCVCGADLCLPMTGFVWNAMKLDINSLTLLRLVCLPAFMLHQNNILNIYMDSPKWERIDLSLEVACIPVWAQNKLVTLSFSPRSFFLPPSAASPRRWAYHRRLFKRYFLLKWRIKINALPRPTHAPGGKKTLIINTRGAPGCFWREVEGGVLQP